MMLQPWLNIKGIFFLVTMVCLGIFITIITLLMHMYLSTDILRWSEQSASTRGAT